MKQKIENLIMFYAKRIQNLKNTKSIDERYKQDAIGHYQAFINNLEAIIESEERLPYE